MRKRGERRGRDVGLGWGLARERKRAGCQVRLDMVAQMWLRMIWVLLFVDRLWIMDVCRPSFRVIVMKLQKMLSMHADSTDDSSGALFSG